MSRHLGMPCTPPLPACTGHAWLHQDSARRWGQGPEGPVYLQATWGPPPLPGPSSAILQSPGDPSGSREGGSAPRPSRLSGSGSRGPPVDEHLSQGHWAQGYQSRGYSQRWARRGQSVRGAEWGLWRGSGSALSSTLRVWLIACLPTGPRMARRGPGHGRPPHRLAPWGGPFPAARGRAVNLPAPHVSGPTHTCWEPPPQGPQSLKTQPQSHSGSPEQGLEFPTRNRSSVSSGIARAEAASLKPTGRPGPRLSGPRPREMGLHLIRGSSLRCRLTGPGQLHPPRPSPPPSRKGRI